MRIGPLRDFITIEQPPTEKDAAGEQSADWVVLANVWANVQQLKGAEILASQQVYGSVDTKVITRFLDGIDVSKRISFDGRILSIISVIDPDGFKRELHLFCKEQD